jgi:hypothetical protein
MGRRPFQETPCANCKKPVNLRADLWSDEDGKAVHSDCYVQRNISSYPAPDVGQQLSVSANSGDVRRQQLL